MEQRLRGTLGVWGEPFVKLRLPKIYNLRTNPYEYADITSNSYYDWYHQPRLHPVWSVRDLRQVRGDVQGVPADSEAEHLHHRRRAGDDVRRGRQRRPLRPSRIRDGTGRLAAVRSPLTYGPLRSQNRSMRMRHHSWMLLLPLAALTSGAVALAQQAPGKPKPEDTEVWKPEPKVVTPGATPGARAVGRDRPVRRQEPRRVGVDVKDKSPAGWTVADGVFTVNKKVGNIETKRTLHQLPAAHRVARFPPTSPARTRGAATAGCSSRRPAAATPATSCRSSIRTTTRPTSTARPAASTSRHPARQRDAASRASGRSTT